MWSAGGAIDGHTQDGSAMRFYEELGFARTGREEPYPNDPEMVEYEMTRAIR